MKAYFKIYNEVFLMEKPIIVQRYFVTEVKVVELNEIGGSTCLQEIFGFNFVQATTKEVNYSASVKFKKFLL